MGFARKMPENMEGLQVVGKKFYKADEGAVLFSVGIHTFEKMGKEAGAKYKYGKSTLYNVEKIYEYMEYFKSGYSPTSFCAFVGTNALLAGLCGIL